MSDIAPKPAATALPSNFPGRTAVFPEDVGRVAYVVFGVQAPTAAEAAPVTAALRDLFGRAGGPGTLERFHYVDEQNLHCDVFLAGWLRADDYADWFAHPDVRAWWAGLPCDTAEPVGVWREVMTPHKDYFQYGAGVDEKAGFAALGDLVPSDKFGYWGGYRDRIPASRNDKFLSPLAAMPPHRLQDTRGRRVSVMAPDNLCFIREGQGWDHADAAERAIWAERMAPVVDIWIDHLRAHPVETGCFSIRFCREQDVATGAEREKQSQIAFLLSLRHIERAARTTHAHLAVKETFTDMFREPKFQPRMHVWVETFILKSGDLVTEYVNCHPATGLLPYFEARPVTL